MEDLDVLPGQGEILRRIRLLERRVVSEPAEWRLRLQVAQAHASVGDFEAAAAHLRTCRELVSEPPVLAAVFFNLGVCLESLERCCRGYVALVRHGLSRRASLELQTKEHYGDYDWWSRYVRSESKKNFGSVVR